MFRNYLKNENNLTRTQNMARAYKSTQSDVLDLFGLGGSALKMEDNELIDLITKAFNENEELAVRAVFYLADVRGGQGVRKILKAGIRVMLERYEDELERLMELIPEYTRWDMLYELEGTPLEAEAFALLREVAFNADRRRESHLIFKWLKSPKTSSKESTRLGKKTARYFGMTEKQYRQFLSRNRARLELVERKMSDNEWDAIEYDKVPSKAALKYRQAFKRHDENRYDNYLNKVLKGEAKMNMGVTYPHEITSKYFGDTGWYGAEITELNQTLEAAWKSLPNYGGDKNILAVADVSGSMFSNVNHQSRVTCMDVSTALAIYTAEHNTGEFANMFMTFSERPELIELSPKDTLAGKLRRTVKAPWGMNTDINKVFELLLKTAVKNRVPQNELPATILIISDMQFDYCSNIDRTNYDEWMDRFAHYGYELPDIVFWQVSTQSNVPVTHSQKGAAIVSGFSPSVLKFIYEGEITTPYDFMVEVLMNPRYDAVGEVFRK